MNKIFYVILMFTFVIGCGGNGSDCDFSELEDVTVSIDGEWLVQESRTSGISDCTETVTYTIDISVSENTITITGNSLSTTGSISNDQFKYKGTTSEIGGIFTYICNTITVASDGQSYTGLGTWTLSGTSFCSGTSTFNAVKQ